MATRSNCQAHNEARVCKALESDLSNLNLWPGCKKKKSGENLIIWVFSLFQAR